MINVYILPTDKPSKLCFNKDKNKFTLKHTLPEGTNSWRTQHIYITNSEEIKEGDWFHLDMSDNDHPDEIHQMGNDKWSKTGGIHFCEGNTWVDSCKKIILTTDQDLIKDGVQEIEDEFLEWFVKNPSCESVEVNSEKILVGWEPDYSFEDEGIEGSKKVYQTFYKIIIPKEEQKQHLIDIMKGDEELGLYDEESKQIKCYCGHTTYCDCSPLEEPKQETLEEVADRLYPYEVGYGVFDRNCEIDIERQRFIEGVEYQKEQEKNKYSEEEVLKFTQTILMQYKFGNTNIEQLDLLKETLQQFKKK